MKITRARDWEGLQVVTVKRLRNGMGVIAEGTRCTVTSSFGGLALRSDPCECCGLVALIRKVETGDVRLLETNYNKRLLEWNKKWKLKKGPIGQMWISPSEPKPEE